MAGAIVNTAFAAAEVADPRLSSYIASRNPVAGLTKATALEYAAHGIRIKAVRPGCVYTAIIVGDVTTPEAERAIIAAHPIGRLAKPEEIAEAVL